MSKAQCRLNHSRNLSTQGKIDGYYYHIERSTSTAKQRKFYQNLWYKFKENNIDINTELDLRNIDHSMVQNPYGRYGYSRAIEIMIGILTDKGLYQNKKEVN